MSEPLPDTWHSREMPLLREAARLIELDELGEGASARDIASSTNLDFWQVIKSLQALEDGGLIDARLMPATPAGRVVGISAEARRLVGQWPTPEHALDRMIAALEAIAANTDDEDTRTRARKVLDGLAGAGRQIGITAAGAALGGQIPGA